MGNVQMRDIKSLAHGNLSEFETRRERRLFDMLDKTKSGSVTLEGLMLATEDPELSAEIERLNLPKFELKPQDLKRSLLTLYHFDRNRVCEMNFEQFVGLIRYLKALDEQEEQRKQKQEAQRKQRMQLHEKQQQLEQQQQQQEQEQDGAREKGVMGGKGFAVKSKLMNSFRRLASKESPGEQASSASHQHEDGKENGLVANDEGDVKRYVCTQDGASVQSETMKVRIPMFGSTSYQGESNPFAQEDAETRATLLARLKTPKGRVRFMQWLFRLADTDHTNCVTPRELYMFLKAVAADGINPECICMDPTLVDMMEVPDSVSSTTRKARASVDEPIEGITIKSPDDLKFHKVVRKVMNSFDIAQDGVLSRSEFMVLADLIEREYELSDTYTGGEYIGDFHLLRTLGLGSEGQVKLAVDERSGKAVAVKIVKRGNTASMSRLDREIQAMMLLHHPNVAAVLEVMETRHHVYLVMELCTGGELSSHINPKNPLAEPVARYYFAQLVSGVAFCHSRGVCHRDLRVENLLLDSHGQLKITDFGHAGTFQPGWDIFQTMFVGSLSHLAPEQIQGTAYSGEKLDVWSIGVILYYFLVGRNPFAGKTVEQLFENISQARFRETGRYSQLNPLAASAIREMLQLDPKDRPQSSELVRHAWLLDGRCEQLVMVKMEAMALPASNGTFDPLALRDALIANLKHHLIETRVLPSDVDPKLGQTVVQCASRFADRDRNIAFTLVLTPPDIDLYEAADDTKQEAAAAAAAALEEAGHDLLDGHRGADDSDTESEDEAITDNASLSSAPSSIAGSDSGSTDGENFLPTWRVSANLLSGDGWFFNRVFMRLVHTKYTCGKLVLIEYISENGSKSRRLNSSTPRNTERTPSASVLSRAASSSASSVASASVTPAATIPTPKNQSFSQQDFLRSSLSRSPSSSMAAALVPVSERRDSDASSTGSSALVSPYPSAATKMITPTVSTENVQEQDVAVGGTLRSRRDSEKLGFISRDAEEDDEHLLLTVVPLQESALIRARGENASSENRRQTELTDKIASIGEEESTKTDAAENGIIIAPFDPSAASVGDAAER